MNDTVPNTQGFGDWEFIISKSKKTTNGADTRAFEVYTGLINSNCCAEPFDLNCNGTLNILETTRKTNFIRSLVLVTSDKCYENMGWIKGYKEWKKK